MNGGNARRHTVLVQGLYASREIMLMLRRRGIDHDSVFLADRIGVMRTSLDKGFRGTIVVTAEFARVDPLALVKRFSVALDKVDPSFALCRHTERVSGACIECEVSG